MDGMINFIRIQLCRLLLTLLNCEILLQDQFRNMHTRDFHCHKIQILFLLGEPVPWCNPHWLRSLSITHFPHLKHCPMDYHPPKPTCIISIVDINLLYSYPDPPWRFMTPPASGAVLLLPEDHTFPRSIFLVGQDTEVPCLWIYSPPYLCFILIQMPNLVPTIATQQPQQRYQQASISQFCCRFVPCDQAAVRILWGCLPRRRRLQTAFQWGSVVSLFSHITKDGKLRKGTYTVINDLLAPRIVVDIDCYAPQGRDFGGEFIEAGVILARGC